MSAVNQMLHFKMKMRYETSTWTLTVLILGVSASHARGQSGFNPSGPGPLIEATKGQVWPKPQNENRSEDYFVVVSDFEFMATNGKCPNLLKNAFVRYEKILNNDVFNTLSGLRMELHNKAPLHFIKTLNVTITGPCDDGDYPELQSTEQYTLTITSSEIGLRSPTIWGVLRGLETFAQLVYRQNGITIVNATSISDFPRFPHRGLLLDTSRHYIPVQLMLTTLDAMAYNKMNVLHWHLSDDQTFPYQSVKYPQLNTGRAVFRPDYIYQQSDVKAIIEHARYRGIRVVPEFDVPGHTRSWGEAFPQLLAQCYNGTETHAGQLGPMDPSKGFTYEFLSGFFEEITAIFPDQFVHLGGDEVNFDCWKSNPNITAFMAANNITSYEDLQTYFERKLIGIVDRLNSKYVVWEEVFTNGIQLNNSAAIVHVWKFLSYPNLLANVTVQNYALLSSCWYLDHLDTKTGHWTAFYKCDPHNFAGSQEQKDRVLGGEACMWGEVVNEHNLASRVWPRASVVAEKLWSPMPAVIDLLEVARRLEEQTCRMNRRGIGAAPPSGPSVCFY